MMDRGEFDLCEFSIPVWVTAFCAFESLFRSNCVFIAVPAHASCHQTLQSGNVVGGGGQSKQPVDIVPTAVARFSE